MPVCLTKQAFLYPKFHCDIFCRNGHYDEGKKYNTGESYGDESIRQCIGT